LVKLNEPVMTSLSSMIMTLLWAIAGFILIQTGEAFYLSWRLIWISLVNGV